MNDRRGSAESLARRAVDVLPQGLLAEQIELARREERPLRVKFGIDPTAPDIHLGHVVALRKLREFQEAGHLVVLIIGDYTARVGDPSGQSAERLVLSEAEIEANAMTFQDQAHKVLDPDRIEVRRNSEWLAMGSDEVFGLIRRFTIARLLERDDFQRRMAAGQPISALELLYPVLQGYDSVAVRADVEVGGTDQKFNLLFGRDVQAEYGVPEQSIVTMPILPGTDGVRRMSKSLRNYVAVTDEPEEMFGKLMSVPDEAMPTYQQLLLDTETHAEHPMEAKRVLARRVTAAFHDEEAAQAAEQRFDRIHVEGGIPERLDELRLDGEGDVHLPALIADGFGLSRSEARRLVAQGGVKLEGQIVDPTRLDIPVGELDGRVLQVGKRRFARLRAGG